MSEPIPYLAEIIEKGPKMLSVGVKIAPKMLSKDLSIKKFHLLAANTENE